jgi:DNA-binding winged helix-turn-helix (wHTH) protein
VPTPTGAEKRDPWTRGAAYSKRVGFTLVFSGIELDAARFELRRNGELLAVQPKVLRVLHYLVAPRERTVPIAELFEHVWP